MVLTACINKNMYKQSNNFMKKDGFKIGRVFYRLKHQILLENVIEGDGKLILVAFPSDPNYCPVIHGNNVIKSMDHHHYSPLAYSDSRESYVVHVHFVKETYFDELQELRVKKPYHSGFPEEINDHHKVLKAMSNAIAYRKRYPVPEDLADLKMFVVQARRYQNSSEIRLADLVQLLSQRPIEALAVSANGDANIGVAEMIDANFRPEYVDRSGNLIKKTYYHSIFYQGRKDFLSEFGKNMENYREVPSRAQALPAEMFLPEIKLLSIY